MRGFSELSAFVECSTGSTPTVATLKKYIDILSAFGYTQLYLGLTDGYKIEGEPYFNFCRGGYTTEDLQEIDAYAEEKGIELRASFQTLAHLAYMTRYDCYREMFDTDDILMVGNEKAYEFIDKMFATLSKGVKSRTIHIGMDEAFRLGLGRYLEENGYKPRRELFLEHLNRVVAIAKKYGLFCEMWSDMFFRMVQGSDFNDSGVIPADVRDSIPEGVRLVHWTYLKQTDEVLTNQLRMNKAICDDLTLAGCAWKSLGLAPNNQYSIEVTERQLRICREQKVDKFMVTLWSDAGAHCSIFSVLPTLFATAEMAKGKSYAEIDKARFQEIVGVSYDDFMLLDNLNNPFFKDLERINSRCYWGLLSDIFLGSYDLLLDEKSNEAYAALAEKYAEIDAGEYEGLFRSFAIYSKVLATKMNIGVQVRKAYREGNKELLQKYATIDIPQMISDMELFMDNFDAWWLWENMAFGLEVHHLYYGGQVARWKYEAKRIRQHLEDGKPIGELEREELPPCIIPQTHEDRCFEMNHHYLISHCGF